MFTSILTSVEYEATVRNLDYSGYLQLHTQLEIPQPPISEDFYKLFQTIYLVEELD